MSNKVCLVATRFESYVQGLPPTYGFRMYDGYQQTYDNTGGTEKIEDNLTLLEWAIENHRPRYSNEDVVAAMLQDLMDSNTGIEINGQWYDWNEIKDYFPS